jgi:hypothetical protein
MDTFPCVVIREECATTPTHIRIGNGMGYAAAVAAAYAKELLLYMPAADVAAMRTAGEATGW